MDWNTTTTTTYKQSQHTRVIAHQHSPASESHHAHSAFEHEALKVGGGNLQLEGFGAVDPIGFLSLSVRIVHALHVLPQLIFPLQDTKGKVLSHESSQIYKLLSLNAPSIYLTLNCLPHVEHRKSLRSEWRNMCKRSLSGRQKAFSQSGHWKIFSEWKHRICFFT